MLATYLFKIKCFLEFGVKERKSFYSLFASFVEGGVIINDGLEQFLSEVCSVKGIENPNEKDGGVYVDPLSLSYKDILNYPFLPYLLKS